MLEDDNTASQTYELYGPTNYSMVEIAALVDREIFKKRRHMNVPKFIMQPSARLLNDVLWWHTTSADEIEREFLDQVIDPSAKTFKDLGMQPGDLKDFTFHYLVSNISIACGSSTNCPFQLKQAYRSSSFYDLPPATEREKREERKYLHVLDDQ